MTVPRLSTRSAIVSASIPELPEELAANWRASRCFLEDVHVVDRRHLVCTFFVDHASAITTAHVPTRVTKYVDDKSHAPYRAKHLKLATLRHYREHYQNLEGTWDPMEGRCKSTSSFEELLKRHNAPSTPLGAHHATAVVTYETENTSLIYCTSLARSAVFRHEHWQEACHIVDVPRFAVLLGAEFARQCDHERHAALTGLDLFCATAVQCSGLDSAVHVHHGPVVYDDAAAEVILGRVPHHSRALATHFFKRRAFKDQQEYRFVLYGVGGRPLRDEFYLRITPDLRCVFERTY